MIYDLPTSVMVDGVSYAIRSDFRDILRIFAAMDDPELTDSEKVYVCLRIFYEDFKDIPKADYQEAYHAAMEFIDNGSGNGNAKGGPRTMDWEQDAKLIFPAINRAAGFEVRAKDYIHWWTFTGYFMEIRDTVYATVLGIRQKKARGKKLEPWEKEFWQQNRELCQLHPKLTEEEKAEKERLNALLR